MRKKRLRYSILRDKYGVFYLFRNYFVIELDKIQLTPVKVTGPFYTMQDFINSNKHGGDCQIEDTNILSSKFKTEFKQLVFSYTELDLMNKWIGKLTKEDLE